MALSNDDIQQLIAILQKGLSNNEPQQESPEPKARKTKKKSDALIKEKPQRVNRFDSMPERRLHKEDVLIDQKLIKSPPTPRRDAFVPLNIVCRVCGRTEQVDPAMIEAPDRYKCNKCSIAAG